MKNSKTRPQDALPFERSYWALPGKVLAGCYPGDAVPDVAEIKLAGLVNSGVAAVLNLMELNEVNWQGKPFADYVPTLQKIARRLGRSVRCERLPISDMGVPAIAQMSRILDLIDDANARGETAYVHCWGGKGRTGTVIGCLLARHGLATGEAALTALNDLVGHKAGLFGRIPQTTAQCDFVRNWEKGQ